jgi:type IV pilus assembly protein PilO
MADSFDKFLSAPTSTKVATLGLLMGIIGAAWYSLYFTDVQAATSRESARTGELTKTLSEERKILKELGETRAEIERLKTVRDEMRDRLPDDADIAELLQQIESQAKIVGLEILRFEPGPHQQEKTFARIPVTMTLRGTFHQVKDFFFYVGRLTRIVNVENISLTTIEQTEQGARVQAVCDATTFMYVKEKKAKKARKSKKGRKRKGRQK